jgi:hypothetical protein
LKFLKTRREKFIITLFILAFIFSLLAAIFTVFGMARWDVGETVKLTREIFETYGLLWGGMIIGLMHFVGVIIFPLVLLFLIRRLEDGTHAPIVNLMIILVWALIEAYAVFVFASGFLDMSTDLFMLISYLQGRPRGLPFPASTINYVAISLSLLVLIFSASFRILEYRTSGFAKRRENKGDV